MCRYTNAQLYLCSVLCCIRKIPLHIADHRSEQVLQLCLVNRNLSNPDIAITDISEKWRNPPDHKHFAYSGEFTWNILYFILYCCHRFTFVFDLFFLFFFFAKTWSISMKLAYMKRPWTFIRMRESSPASIASVDGKEHLSEVMFSALVGFSLQGTWRNDLISGSYRTPRTSDYGFHEVGSLFVESSMSWVRVLHNHPVPKYTSISLQISVQYIFHVLVLWMHIKLYPILKFDVMDCEFFVGILKYLYCCKTSVTLQW